MDCCNCIFDNESAIGGKSVVLEFQRGCDREIIVDVQRGVLKLKHVCNKKSTIVAHHKVDNIILAWKEEKQLKIYKRHWLEKKIWRAVLDCREEGSQWNMYVIRRVLFK